ncbi:glycine/betaine ABC transporter [Kouleothrix aurantiaca]|uniref:Glycine/betaine ABC transporter n=1 Tax=Kouleothrix aurantiaca TaxID=186479 RepID=A0A0P9CVS8_9CHLR|nr:glycine/betaine ABC transporter [Kouleothrix aurantiaca]
MQLLLDAYTYFLANQDRFWEALGRHLSLSLSALALSILIGVPLGIWIVRRARAAQLVINGFGALRLVPSLAILFLALPYLGTGFRPALLALTVLPLPPVLINTYAGLHNVDRALTEAAYGMGLEARQVLGRIELPLALPAIIAGIRTAAVEVVSSATLAAFIGGGGLGDFITRGFALYEPRIMLVGAIPVALLALAAEGILGGVQRVFSVPEA